MISRQKSPVIIMNSDSNGHMNNQKSAILTSAINFIFNRSSQALVISVWLSALLFGLYILTFYVVAFEQGAMAKWNENLPGLYQSDKNLATIGMAIHFTAGGIILILGSIQLISSIRNRYPKFHRMVGRVYISACILTALGGLVFILINGTIGGTVMSVGFSLYGVLMLVCAINAIRFARASNFVEHRAWAIRLYALAIGSWLYRMDYGFWALLADSAGHTSNFQGPFDYVMNFFFYIPSLAVAEIFIRRKCQTTSTVFKSLASLLLVIATGFIALGTYYFTRYYWGPSILSFFG
jgi:uncharacterized membrane protein